MNPDILVRVEHENAIPYEAIRPEYAHGEIVLTQRNIELPNPRSCA